MEREYSYRLKTLVEGQKLNILYPSTDYEKVLIKTGDVHRPGLQLAGFYDYFDPARVQLVGRMEVAFLMKFSSEERREKVDFYMSKKFPALIICHDAELLPEFMEAAEKYDVSLCSTSKSTSAVMSDVIRIIKMELAPRVTRHGVLVEVYGMGLLLLGESGVGKSEAAIELLKRGHRLIADDAVEIKAVADYLEGTAPELIRHYVELRGIGVIDVRQIFGVGAVKARQNIHLVVNLEPWREGMLYDRLGINEQTVTILGVDVAAVTIPVKPGRNLAVILEVAAMNQRQKFMGYNAALEFTRQINRHFDEKLS
ncbi:Hpr(Ser) kinase/phosphatase [Sporobacter termitidis DSM 10068]|uniref:HPr kinase/phosphorylase n=1 Tax=Sporobacter termitidis DSM 10068 TaxID=1123282 RepID=A0A1M5X373_9FIRM|nr:HPr(Ser) kinase/phosphatase [Sporobacter termitidis]SHH93653.1 Hpr(Ser) kinase/phosphatase [Sporobacter termitidis DSM 10068]